MVISALRKMIASKLSASFAWSERLRDAVVKLADLNASTEKEFLFLCERLQDFHLRAKEISELSLSVSGRMSGEETAAVMAELHGVIKQVKHLEDESQQGASALGAILNGFESIRKHLAGFEKVVMNLNMLCNSLRIESARIRGSDSGLTTLVDDVRQLAGNIGRQSAHLLRETESMSGQVRENLTTIIHYKEEQQGHARFILDDTGSTLTSLMDSHQRSSASLQDLASRWGLISKSIEEIVSSLQFQDITRQRVEHVVETLNGFIGVLKPYSVLGKGGSREHVREAMAGCELQAAQLAHGKEEMTAAVKRIILNLRNVAAQIGAMSEEIKIVSGWSSEAGHSYFDELKSRLSILVQVLSEYAHLSRELEKATGQVSETIGRMSTLVKEIEKVGIDMKMIALNACIHAAHIGEAGLGLGVLSESLHQLSVDSTRQIETISSSLKDLILAASGLSSEAHGTEPGSRVREDGPMDLENIIAPIHRLHMDTTVLLSRIEQAGKKLVSDIEKNVGGITVHKCVEEVVEEVRSELNEVVSQMRSVLPAAAGLKPDGDLKEVEQRYTMHSERKIHHSVLSNSVPAMALNPTEKVQEVKESPTGTGNRAAEDLGKNVELF